MIQEIGSEFSYDKHINGLGIELPQKVVDYTYTFSGRTAIETVLINEPQIKKVMLPSYCCASMIDPFRVRKIEVLFYPVYFCEKFQIDVKIEDDVDALLWCNYFGYSKDMPDLTSFIERGGVIIEDITHSLFSKEKYHSQSKYIVASIRKWEPIFCGGYCGSTSQKLNYKPTQKPDYRYIEKKKQAMCNKKKYLNGNYTISKSNYLEEFSYCNEWLKKNYEGLTIDDESKSILQNINYNKQVQVRIQNANILYDELEDCRLIKPMFMKKDMDCPLFVPILIENKNRDNLRKVLCENQIYCPIHWPKLKKINMSNIFDIEMSLVCDHRYGVEDMRRIAHVIKKWEKYKGGRIF